MKTILILICALPLTGCYVSDAEIQSCIDAKGYSKDRCMVEIAR